MKIGDRYEVEALCQKGVPARWRGLMASGAAMRWPRETRVECVVAEDADEEATPRKVTPTIMEELAKDRRYFRVNRAGDAPDEQTEAARVRIVQLEAEIREIEAKRAAAEKRARSTAAAEQREAAAKAEAEELRRKLAEAEAALAKAPPEQPKAPK